MTAEGDPPELRADEFEVELAAIVRWWMDQARDQDRGGVYGQIADDNTVCRQADKGVILQARVLWFFSEVARLQRDPDVAAAAHAQYRYFLERFLDRQHGGVVWSVDAAGVWVSDRKQVYAQAFAIYALCAYSCAFADAGALDTARALAHLLEERAWDHQEQGYVEAFGRDWRPIEDVRLSERDLDAPKTMNTHLHVLEAYTALHRVADMPSSEAALERILALFLARFVRPDGRHLALFYSMSWELLCTDESYGHDIESSWLLGEAADALGDAERVCAVRRRALGLADGVFEAAMDRDGGLAYEWLSDGTGLVRERHWWPQAEALVGFYNAYQISGEARFLDAAARLWRFIRGHQVNRQHGEWRWLADIDAPAAGPYKVGFWKGPYHNGRAMMEMLRRIEER